MYCFCIYSYVYFVCVCVCVCVCVGEGDVCKKNESLIMNTSWCKVNKCLLFKWLDREDITRYVLWNRRALWAWIIYSRHLYCRSANVVMLSHVIHHSIS